MIYELAVVAKEGLPQEKLSKIISTVHETINAAKGEILIEDDWGVHFLAQPTKSGVGRGHYVYFIFKGGTDLNAELIRKLGLLEDIVRKLILHLGEDKDQDAIIKNFKTPFSKKYRGTAVEEEEEEGLEDMDKDRRKFAKRRSCWFSAKKIKADWKDPSTYAWLINEFGKITPARVSGVSRKHQRFVTAAIKQARVLGVASNLSNRIAARV